jgi:hypothetical protein
VNCSHLLEKEGLIDVSSKKRNFAPHPDFVRQGINEMLQAKEKRENELEAEANAPLKVGSSIFIFHSYDALFFPDFSPSSTT